MTQLNDSLLIIAYDHLTWLPVDRDMTTWYDSLQIIIIAYNILTWLPVDHGMGKFAYYNSLWIMEFHLTWLHITIWHDFLQTLWIKGYDHLTWLACGQWHRTILYDLHDMSMTMIIWVWNESQRILIQVSASANNKRADDKAYKAGVSIFHTARGRNLYCSTSSRRYMDFARATITRDNVQIVLHKVLITRGVFSWIFNTI